MPWTLCPVRGQSNRIGRQVCRSAIYLFQARVAVSLYQAAFLGKDAGVAGRFASCCLLRVQAVVLRSAQARITANSKNMQVTAIATRIESIGIFQTLQHQDKDSRSVGRVSC